MRCDDDFLYRKKDEQGFRRGALLFLYRCFGYFRRTLFDEVIDLFEYI